MIKLYDPNEPQEIELRIEVEQEGKEISLNIVDIEGNYIETFAVISEKGMEFLKIDPEYAPFNLSSRNYISTKYVR